MVHEFKKIGAAAAVAGALLASGSSYATVQLSEPGDVVLVPYVICNPAANNQNTLVGLITFDKARLGLQYENGAYAPAPWRLASYTVGGLVPPTPGTAKLPERKTTKPTAYNKTIHWYFYNTRSEHLLDGVLPATDNDFVRFDWCSAIQATGQDELNGKDGYLIFTSDEVDRNVEDVPSFALYGHAYQIQGNWESQAFIPVLPNPVLSLGLNGSIVKNIIKRDGYPAFARLLSGTDFTHVNADDPSDVTAGQRDVYMRYFLDDALATENRMVFWFNSNATRVAAGETYDSEQVYRSSFSVNLGDELTILRSTPKKVVDDPRQPGPAFPGMLHEEEESYSGATVKNTGIVRLGVPEFVSATGGVNSNVPFLSSGVSFNMLGLGARGNTAQLQTEMSTVGPAY